jgi:hypothetical protein
VDSVHVAKVARLDEDTDLLFGFAGSSIDG